MAAACSAGERSGIAAGSTLRLLPALERLYGRFARWRFRRRCAESACGVPAGIPAGGGRRDS